MALIAICSQGVAACNIGGVTLHGFAGVGLAKGPAESLAAQVISAKWTAQRWRSAKVCSAFLPPLLGTQSSDAALGAGGR